MVKRTEACEAIQVDEVLTVGEAGKLLNLLAGMDIQGDEDVIELRHTQEKFVVSQLREKLAKSQGTLSPPMLFCHAQPSPCYSSPLHQAENIHIRQMPSPKELSVIAQRSLV